jgi:hypothetical protein
MWPYVSGRVALSCLLVAALTRLLARLLPLLLLSLWSLNLSSAATRALALTFPGALVLCVYLSYRPASRIA